jgi:hypothetical protein
MVTSSSHKGQFLSRFHLLFNRLKKSELFPTHFALEMDCRNFLETINHYLVSPLSIFFNSFALYIIMNKSKDDLSSYKVVLVIMCIQDLFMTGACFLFDIVSQYSSILIY